MNVNQLVEQAEQVAPWFRPHERKEYATIKNAFESGEDLDVDQIDKLVELVERYN